MANNLQRFIVKCIKVCFIATAVVTGMLFAVVWRSYERAIVDVPYHRSYSHEKEAGSIRRLDTSYSKWLTSQGLKSRLVPEEDISYGPNGSNIETEAQFLSKRIKVLCLILSKGRNKASGVKETWGKHCHRILFYGSYIDDKIPVHRYSSLEPSHVSFCKILKQVFNSDKEDASNETSSDFDWLLISQDSSYVIVENVRRLVAPLDSKQVFHLGRPVKRYAIPAFNALDSVIVLSKGSVDFIVKHFFVNESSCRQSHFFFESFNRTVQVSRSFEVSLSIMLDPKLFIDQDSNSSEVLSVSDTRDNLNRSRFLPFTPEMHLIPDEISEYSAFHRHNILSSGKGFKCCSDTAITFGELSPSKMYLLEYFLYHLTVFRNSDKGLGNNPAKNTHDTQNDISWNEVDVGQGSVFEGHQSLSAKKLKNRKKSLWFNF